MIEEKTLAEISRRSALYAETGATMHAPQNETTVALVDEVRRLRDELSEIAHATGSMPLEFGDEAQWFRSQFYAQVGRAARAIHEAKP